MRNLVRLTLVFGLCALFLALSQGMVFAQGGGGGGGGGGGRGGDPAARQEQMVDRTITDLELKDEEATAIKPLLTEVVKCQMSQMMGRMGGGRGGRVGGGAAAGAGGGRTQAPEFQALRDAVDKADTPAAELKAKMTAVRDARKKAEEDLQKARKALKEAVTARQEAKLLLAGILD